MSTKPQFYIFLIIITLFFSCSNQNEKVPESIPHIKSNVVSVDKNDLRLYIKVDSSLNYFIGQCTMGRAKFNELDSVIKWYLKTRNLNKEGKVILSISKDLPLQVLISVTEKLKKAKLEIKLVSEIN